MLDEDGVPVVPPPEFAPTAAAQKRSDKKAVVAARAKGAADEDGGTPPEINPRFGEALRLMRDTGRSLFITGKAGTGKSTLLRHFRREAKKNIVVLAPTGIAALNVGGQTIHNFFRFSIDVTPQKAAARKKPRNAKLYKKIETIVIDEISMVRADLLDCVDAFLRLHGPEPGQAFGGVQMIFIGDLYQLPPVVTAQEREIFESHYETPYFFSAYCLSGFSLATVELEKVYRQKDGAFVALLNRVRENAVTDADIVLLNSRVVPAASPRDERFSISLTATNRHADEINAAHLAALEGQARLSVAEVEGDFGREYFPAAPELSFKPGAQVMMLTNDREGRWVNGSLGVIESAGKDIDKGEYIAVRLQDTEDSVAVFRHAWEVYRFALSGDEILSEPAGTFIQFPFRLAWAVTIHKSQGKTFDRVTIDIGQGAFAAGQVYVALSRCTSFEGITLQTPLQRRHIRTDPRIAAFMENRSGAPEDEAQAELTPVMLIERAIRNESALDISYLKSDGEKMRLTVMPYALGLHTHENRIFMGMKAHCRLDGEARLFSVERILEIADSQSIAQ
ncbi:MAG: AAA family ATPase [Alphaproteobacteria bacterium]|nr:AAA family ATPase [Alphaproteobacteria bacterium]